MSNKRITYKKTSEGTEVYLSETCRELRAGDIPKDTVKLHIPKNSCLSQIDENALPWDWYCEIPKTLRDASFKKYLRSIYIKSEDNSSFILWHRGFHDEKDADGLIADHILPSCEIIAPTRENKRFFEYHFNNNEKTIQLKSIVKLFKGKYKSALKFCDKERNDYDSWKVKGENLVTNDGKVIASLDSEVSLYGVYYYGWNSNDFPYPCPWTYGYRGWKHLIDYENEGLEPRVFIDRKTENDEYELVGELDMMASREIFNFVLNNGFFDPEAG